MRGRLDRGDALGVVRPAPDAHTLGVGAVSELLEACGVRVVPAGHGISDAFGAIDIEPLVDALRAWIAAERISAIGLSYRLDGEDAARHFGRLVEALRRARALSSDSGPIRALYFAGLPPTCELIRERYPFVDATFRGDETAPETLEAFGLDPSRLPASVSGGMAYDEDRLAFGRELVAKGAWEGVKPRPLDYPGAGAWGDGIAARVAYYRERKLGPALRAHAGPYLPDRKEAVRLFESWARSLAKSGYLDVLSIGSSQLTQERFGEDWGDAPNGGGVPIATEEELASLWRAARPMLVRAYSGVSDVAAMARILESNIDIAWHALSLWWFCKLDGRGPNGVRENLERHFEAMRYIAATGKPLEPNVPHHFAFRGADDVSYVASGYVAAKAAKAAGVRRLVVQTMLNTPRQTRGLNDLAKARALRSLVRGLEGPGFEAYLQPRGGLDYFSPDEAKAKAQLAAVTALMDDIEPDDAGSPDIIHVVSWSEGTRLADPEVIDDSLKITMEALTRYRRAKRDGIWSPERAREAEYRAEALEAEARTLVEGIERHVPDPYSPAGLYRMLSEGWFALPALAELRDEFRLAASWRTIGLDGGIATVDDSLARVSAAERVAATLERRERGPLQGR